MASLEQIVNDALARYLAGTDSREADFRRLAAEHDVLPVFPDWSGFIGLRRDGTLLWISDEEKTPRRPDPWESHLALCRAGELFPALEILRPKRNADSVDCQACDGTGVVAGVPANVRCRCAGLGWLPRSVADFLEKTGRLDESESENNEGTGE